MKIKYLILFFLVALFTYLLKTHSSCTDYNGNFHYSFHVVSFHLNELTSSENQVPIFVVRLFHNKITVLLFDIFSRYIQFFNVSYLINILGLAGLCGLLYFYFSLFNQKTNKFTKIFGIMILLLPFLEIFQVIKQAFILKVLIFILPYQIASLIGSVKFMGRGKRNAYAIYLILLILSIGWIIVFKNELQNFCTI